MSVYPNKTDKTDFSARGFSLLEVIVAIAILTLGILAVTRIFPLALKISKTAEQATIAANLNQAKLEESFSLGYDGLAIGTIEAKHRLASDPTNPFYQYQRETAVEYVDEDLQTSVAETGLKKVTVTTYWHSPILAAERSATVSLLISQRD